MKKVLVYLNQFFGQVGGEEKATMPPELIREPVGVALAYKDALRDVRIMGTVVCGDNYFNEHNEEARKRILRWVKELSPDLFIAGPAFNAGRYGMACAGLCSEISKDLGIPAITGLYMENPAVAIYKKDIYILSCGKSVASMKADVGKISALAGKLLRGEAVGTPEEDHYIPRGKRVNVFKEKNGAARALDMLQRKLAGQPFASEIPIPTYDHVQPAPALADVAASRIAILSSGGIVPKNNPDHLPAATARHYCKYPLNDPAGLNAQEYEAVHAGYDPVYASENPNRVIPVDLLKEFEAKGLIGELYPEMFVTTGNSTSVADSARMGREIALELVQRGVQGAIMTST